MRQMENLEKINTALTFDSIVAKANEIQKKCLDYKVKAESIRMDDQLNLVFQYSKLPLSSFAAGELCGKLSVPSRYFSRLADADPILAAANINCWLVDDKRTLFLRQYENHIRGVLSGSYSVYDTPEILQAVNEVFGSNHFRIKGSFINEERLHLRLVENQMLDIDGEDLFAGVTIDSSDIGRSGLRVKFFIYKQVCTNGLVIAKSAAKLFKQKHIGITHEDFTKGLKEGLKTFYTLKDKIVESIKETNKIPVAQDIDDLIEEIKERTTLSTQAAEKVVELMNVKYAPTRWGLINGITEVAQEFTLETRLQLEEIAGNMLV